MPVCPLCKAPISDDDARLATCTVCGHALPQQTIDAFTYPEADFEDWPSRPTPPTARHDETLEFRSAAEQSPTPASSSTPDEMPTLELPSSSGSGPAPDATLEQNQTPLTPPAVDRETMAGGPSVPNSLEPSAKAPRVPATDDACLEQTISGIWGKEINRRPSPATSLRLDSGSPRPGLHVNIKSRVLQRENQKVGSPADYELHAPLGEGGMGVVFEARQTSVDRTVAVKMLKKSTAISDLQRGKFLSEAIVTGELDHPNIVPIYDVGADESGDPFYSMKCVHGTPWSDAILKKSFQENTEILMRVADAVAFAHSHAVLHRDLKPENVMLGGYGEVLLMDWGLALPIAASRNDLTAAGTPAYMAPEMAAGPFDDIGYPSDVYLLGAILYEIITGRPPHTGKNVQECLMAAAKNRILPTDKSGELLDIAQKAMASRPDDRYQTVGEFQQAIREYLSHSESILLAERASEELDAAKQADQYQMYAKALSVFQEAVNLWPGNAKAQQGVSEASLAYADSAERKGDYDLATSLLDKTNAEHLPLLKRTQAAWEKREAQRRRLFLSKLLGAALAVSLFVVISGALLWIRTERDKAVAAEKTAVDAKNIAVDARKTADEQRSKAVDAQKVAVKERGKAREAEKEAVEKKKQAERAKAKEEYTAYLARIGQASAKIEESAFVSALAVLDECPQAYRHWEWHRLKYLATQAESFETEMEIEAVAVSPDKRFLVAGGWGPHVQVFDPGKEESSRLLPVDGDYVFALAFSPDGRYLAIGTNDSDESRGYLKVWDVRDWDWSAEQWETNSLILDRANGHEDAVLDVVFREDSEHLLTTSHDGTARLWDLQLKRVVRRLGPHGNSVRAAALRPPPGNAESGDSGPGVLTASRDGYARVWPEPFEVERTSGLSKSARPRDGINAIRFRGHSGSVNAVACSPDGQRVASGGQDRRILLWNPDSVQRFDFSALNGGGTNPTPSFDAIEGHEGPISALAFFPDGRRLVSASDDNTIRIWDLNSNRALVTLRGHGGPVRSCAFLDKRGRRLVSGGLDKTVRIWDVEKYQEYRVIGGHLVKGHQHEILGADLSPDGTLIATASRDRTLRLWDLETGDFISLLEEGHAIPPSSAIFFDNGKRLLTTTLVGNTRVWDVNQGTELLSLKASGPSAAAAVSHHSKWILLGGGGSASASSPSINGEPPQRLSSRVSSSTDSQTHQVNARLVDADTGELLMEFVGDDNKIDAVAFSPDDRLVFCGDASGKCWVYRVEGGQLQWKAWKHSHGIRFAAFAMEGQYVLTACHRSLGWWDVSTGTEPRVRNHPEPVTAFAVSPDGRLALTACADRSVRLWDVANGEPRWTGVVSLLDRRATPVPSNITIKTVAFLVERNAAIAVLSDESVQLWDLQSGEPLLVEQQTPRPADDRSLWTAAVSPSAETVLLVRGDGAFLERIDDRSEVMRFSDPRTVASVRFSRDGKQLVAANWDGTARLWDIGGSADDHRPRIVGKLHGGHSDFVHDAAFSPDGTVILTAGEQTNESAGKDVGFVQAWDAATREPLAHSFKGHTAAVKKILFSSDGRYVLTASQDKSARIWDAHRGHQIHCVDDHEGAVLAAAFSADDRFAVTGSEDTTARLWNIASGKSLVVSELAESELAEWIDPNDDRPIILRGHTASVTAVAFSQDGRRVITGSQDGTAKLWDLLTGKEVLTLRGHREGVTYVAFAKGDSKVITASRDGTLIIYNVHDGAIEDSSELQERIANRR